MGWFLWFVATLFVVSIYCMLCMLLFVCVVLEVMKSFLEDSSRYCVQVLFVSRDETHISVINNINGK